MKNTGIVRQVDELGRVVLPKELRDTMGIKEKDPLEFYVDDVRPRIMLKAYTGNACIFCGDINNIQQFKGKLLCQNCMNDMPKQAGLTPKKKIETLPVIQSVTKTLSESKAEPLPETDPIITSNDPKRTRHDGEAMLIRLYEELSKDPNAKQGVLANRLGISAPYVSILMKKMKERDLFDSIQQTAGGKSSE